MPKHRLVLLDVDQTLLFNQQDMNEALIDALIVQGVDEVYLFTNMGLSDITSYGRVGAPFSRMDVIAHLASKGIRTKGVVTPADPYLPRNTSTQPVDAAFQTLYYPLMQKRINAGTPLNLADYSSEDTLEFLFAELEWSTSSYLLRETNQLMAGESKKISRPGLCLINKETGKSVMPQQFIHNLDEAITFFITGAHAAEHRKQYLLEKYSLPTEFDLDIAEAKYASSDPKGAMMAHILVHSELIQSDTTVYFFDDRSEHLQAVTESHARHNRASNATIKTCLVPTDYSQALHPSQKALYQSCLGGNTVEVNPISQEPSTSLNASFFLRVLAHPATKAVAALLVVAGIIGLVCGGLGLAGVGIGLSILASSVLTGLGSGTVGLGAGLGIAGFFSFSKLESKSRREELSTYEVSNQMH